MKPNWRIVLYALALWAQLIFGGGMTLWRDALVLSGNWRIYSVSISPVLNSFAEFAMQNIPPRESVAYLSPPSEDYKIRYARLAVWLYPRRVVWMATGPIYSPIAGWTPIDLRDSNWLQTLHDRNIQYILIEDLSDVALCPNDCSKFDATRYLRVIK